MERVDILVILLYLASVVAVGLKVSRSVEQARDYFLAGKSLAWWVVGFSIIATNLSVNGYIGAAGGAYNVGIAQANFEWIGAVPAMILACFVFIPLYWRAGVFSIAEYLGLRYGPAVRVIAALITIVVTLLGIAVSLWTIALTIQSYLGWPTWVGVLATAAVVGGYSTLGGLAAVAFTDVLQVLLMVGGGVALVLLGLGEVGGLDQFRQLILERSPSHLDVYLPLGHRDFPWLGVIVGLGIILSPAYWISSQAILQRTMGARSEWDASAAMMLAALAKLFMPLVIVFPGLLAFSLGAELQFADQSLPWVVANVLPPGLSGLMFVGIVAALQSTLDSGLNATSLLVTRDLRYSLFKDADPAQDLVVGRVVTVVALLVGVCITPLVTAFSGVYLFMSTALALFQGPLLAVIVLGATTWSATPKAAIAAILTGVPFAALLRTTGLNPFYGAFATFLFTVAVMVVVSRLSEPRSPAEISGLVYRRGRP